MSMLSLSIFFDLLSIFQRGTFQAINPNSTSSFKTFLPQLEEKIWRNKEIVEIYMMKLWDIDYLK